MMDTPRYPDISSQVYLIWACDYDIDGPLSGLCEVDGEVCWFDIIDWEIHPGRGTKDKYEDRLFQVYRLTKVQRAAEVRRHECFIQNVGSHFDYVVNRKNLNTGNIRPDRFWRKYFSEYPDHKNRMGCYDGNKVIGVFYLKKLPKKLPPNKGKKDTVHRSPEVHRQDGAVATA